MKKAFLIYGITIVFLFGYGTYHKLSFSDSLKSGKWGPQGHSFYHK